MRLVILTEAGFEKGFGHFVRMAGVRDRLSARGIQVTTYLDADETAVSSLDLCHVTLSSWNTTKFVDGHISDSDVVLVDSYHVDEAFLSCVRSNANKLVVVDDNIRLEYEDTVVINPNFFAEWLHYPAGRGNTYLLGKDYTLLREPFEFSGKRATKEQVSKVLITLGGTDVRGKTVEVIQRIKTIDPSVSLRVVATKAYRNLDVIDAALDEDDRLILNASAREMCDLMQEVDFALSAAGGTSNELIKMQCPSALLVVADNQKNVRLLFEHGLVDLLTLDDDSAIERLFDRNKRVQLVDAMAERSSDKCAADTIESLMKGSE